MSEYTYTDEDFEQAEFAIDPRGMGHAQRHLVRWDEGDRPWNNGFGGPISTKELVDAGCIPVYAEPYSPERDPVADLAQAMEDVLPEEAGSPVALRRYAEALVEYGVRVVTDDE